MRMLFMGSVVVVLLAACNANPPVKSGHAEPDEKVSYGIGYRVGLDRLRGEIDADRNSLLQAMEDVLDGKSPRYSHQAIQSAIAQYRELTLVAIVNPAEPDGNVQVSD